MRGLIPVLVFCGCITSDVVTCPNGQRCGPGFVCISIVEVMTCVLPEAIAKCEDLAAGDACDPSDDRKHCLDGVCVVTCGNANVGPNEECDDGNDVAGDDCSSVCRFETCGNGFVDPQEGCDDADHVSGDGCASTCIPETADWIDITPEQLGARAGMGLGVTWSETIGFGGISEDGLHDDTWRFTGTWTRLSPPTSPPRRERAGMVGIDTRAVLFGGFGDVGALDDTWEWDGTAWHELHPSVRPPARYNSQLAYDPYRMRVVMFGGIGITGEALGDLWELDSTNEWIERTEPGAPWRGTDIAMAFDPNSGNTIVCSNADPVTHLWNGTVWSTPSVLSNCPSTGATGRMYFNGQRSNIEMFRYDGRLYSWNGLLVGWSQLVTTGTLPPSRWYPILVYVSGNLFIFGGHASGTLADTSMYLDDGFVIASQNRWDAIGAPIVSPSPRSDGAFAYDLYAGRSVLFGGTDYLDDYDETWFHDQAGWQRFVGTGPTARHGAAMTFDGRHGRVIIFGGRSGTDARLGDTWALQGDSWIEVAQGGVVPPPRDGATLVYGEVQERSILFGGMTGAGVTDETWSFDGDQWSQLAPTSVPPRRARHAMTYDARRAVLVMFGGVASNDSELADTWEFDGTTWIELTPATAPPARRDARLVFDPLRSTVILLGGSTASGITFSDRWEWDGTAWTSITDDPRITRSAAHVAFDAVRGGIVMFGGVRGLFAGRAKETQVLRFGTSAAQRETCRVATDDLDGDGAAGCDDDDCWGRCRPSCPPGAATCAPGPSCGDGSCNVLLEDPFICPADC